jgi:hypothetical protein
MKAQFELNSFGTISNLDVDDLLPISHVGGYISEGELDPEAFRLNFWQYDAEVEVTNAAGDARAFSICFQSIDHNARPNSAGWEVCEYDENSDSIEDVTEFLANDADAKAFAEWIEAKAEEQAQKELTGFIKEYGPVVIARDAEEMEAANAMCDDDY